METFRGKAQQPLLFFKDDDKVPHQEIRIRKRDWVEAGEGDGAGIKLDEGEPMTYASVK